MTDNRWIVPLRHAPGNRSRIFCFHHAGGSALSFGAWPRKLADGISVFAVQLPGRDGVQPIGAARRVQDLVPPLMRAWERFHAHTDIAVPFVFYGHSLGALVAFELTRALHAARASTPAALFVSGRRAPHRPLEQPALCDLPEAELLRALEHLGGMPPLLLASEKWRAFFMATLRADLRLSDRYEYTAAAPLHVPVHAFRGERDPILGHEEFEAWRRETRGEFSATPLPGGHFFDDAGTRRLCSRLQAALARPAPAPPAAVAPALS